MSKDNELDEILASLEKDKARLADLLNSAPVEMPRVENQKPSIKQEEIAPSAPLEAPKQDKKVEAPAPRKEKKPKQKRVKKGIGRYFKVTFSKDIKKSAKIVIAIIVAIAIAIVGIVAITSNAKNGYIKDYEKKYEISFPDGIREQFCDEYGKNQSIRGTLTINSEKQFVESTFNYRNPYLSPKSSISDEMQFISINANSDDYSVEDVLATSKGYLDSNQEIVFSTLFDEQRYHIIACYYTNKSDNNGDDYIFPYDLSGNLTKRSFVEFEDKIKSRELYDTGYKFDYYDKFINVAIDSDFMDDYAFVIVGVRADDKIEKSTSAIDNKMIHYPKSYYEANDLHNPYKYAKDWQPEYTKTVDKVG